jgi:hypothetical protein
MNELNPEGERRRLDAVTSPDAGGTGALQAPMG